MVITQLFSMFASGLSSIFGWLSSFGSSAGFNILAFLIGAILIRLLFWAINLGGEKDAGK